MSLLETLRKDMFSATKDGNTTKADIIKMAIAAIKNAEIEKGEVLDDKEIVKVLRKEVKKIQDSIAQFTTMGRQDLVDRETKQLEVLQEYLPKQMSEEEIKKVVKAKIVELEAEGMKDFGKVMGVVMKELAEQAEGGIVKDIIESLLNE
jgi:hypothetical protein